MMRFCGAKITISRIVLAHPVTVLALDKEPLSRSGETSAAMLVGKNALAGFLNGVPVQIGGEDLKRKVLCRLELAPSPP